MNDPADLNGSSEARAEIDADIQPVNQFTAQPTGKEGYDDADPP